MKGMDITIRGHRAWVEFIKGYPAGEGRREPSLHVWLSIDSRYAVSGFGITLPLKEYSPDELRRLVEVEGSRQWEMIIFGMDAERKTRKDLAKRTQQAEEIARKVADAAGLELLEDPPPTSPHMDNWIIPCRKY